MGDCTLFDTVIRSCKLFNRNAKGGKRRVYIEEHQRQKEEKNMEREKEAYCLLQSIVVIHIARIRED